MNKKEFLGKLRKALRKLDKKECDKYISYYEEIISDMVDGGMSEQEAVEKQGAINDIAVDILKNTDVADMVKTDKIGIVLICITILLALASIICMIALPEAGAVSLVKGDGAVSVFVAEKIKEPMILYIVALIVALIDIIYFIFRRKLYGAVIGTVAIIAIVLMYVIFDIILIDKNNNDSVDPASEVSNDNSVEAKTEDIVNLLNEGNYATLQDEYAADEMKEYFTSEIFDDAKSNISDDWGEFVSNGKIYSSPFTQNGKDYVVVQVNSMYENISVSYTITFDVNMKIAGIFMK